VLRIAEWSGICNLALPLQLLTSVILVMYTIPHSSSGSSMARASTLYHKHHHFATVPRPTTVSGPCRVVRSSFKHAHPSLVDGEYAGLRSPLAHGLNLRLSLSAERHPRQLLVARHVFCIFVVHSRVRRSLFAPRTIISVGTV